MVIDCTLSILKVPGFPELEPEFGTKKPDMQHITARENNINTMLPFTRQRPFLVTESSSTSAIEAHTAFVIQAAGITLTMGSGAFIGCKVRVFNLSSGASTVVYGENEGESAALEPETDIKLEWHGMAWKATASTDTPDGWGAYREGRNLLEVLGVETPQEAMAILVARCNNGETAANGEPNFSGLQIGDYIDGLDLSAIPAENEGDAGQEWNDTYKNNQIVISGFNTYLNAGDTTNTKNHILFTFGNCPIRKRMNATNDNTGGYITSELRAFLEGTAGDGTGAKAGVTTAAFLTTLKAQIGNYLYTIRKAHSTKGGQAWNNYTVFLPSELEVFGYPTYGDEGVYLVADTATAGVNRAGWNTNVQFPIFAASYKHRIKQYNGARMWWWEQTPFSGSAAAFCGVSGYGGAAGDGNASAVGGCAPAFCVAG